MTTTNIHTAGNILRRRAIAVAAVIVTGLAIGFLATTNAHAQPKKTGTPGAACHGWNGDHYVYVGTYNDNGDCCAPGGGCIKCSDDASSCFDGTGEPLSLTPTVATGNPITILGRPVNVALAVSGGTPPYTLTVTGLPPGLAYSGSQIFGTTTSAGIFTVSATARDATGATATTSFTWTVDVTMPNVLSYPRSEAISLITSVGLIPSVSSQKACIDPGAVLTQNPVGGVALVPGSTVYITADSGTRATCLLK
jgi:Putative Ig domain